MLNLKDSLDRDDPLIGTFSTSGSPVMVETIGYAGFDFLVIDCEHAPVSPYGGELENLIRTAWSADICPIVRVTWNDPGQILKAMDMGASAVIVPHVNDAEQAAAAVSAAHHHPKGRRSATPAVLASRRGLTSWRSFYERAQDETLVIPIIEEREGVERIEEIAAVPNLGGIFFGPFDLRVSMGSPNDARDGDASSERERVYSAARAQGVPVLDLAWSPESALDLLSRGAQAVTVGVDVSLFAEGCKELADECARVKDLVPRRPAAAATSAGDDGRRPTRARRSDRERAPTRADGGGK